MRRFEVVIPRPKQDRRAIVGKGRCMRFPIIFDFARHSTSRLRSDHANVQAEMLVPYSIDSIDVFLCDVGYLYNIEMERDSVHEK